MSRKEKLVERFLRQPKDFTYQELSKLLSGFGYIEEKKGRTSGSRVLFYNNEKEHSIMLHKPHPGNIIKSYALKYVLQELETMGFIEKTDN
ncbi:MAG: type II toxin-antitoxin system HicA family toxin [Bacteroidia bacterium]|nr:type II toxin-antitoxin system HicA family toxin [Bacteroidia bacterium]